MEPVTCVKMDPVCVCVLDVLSASQTRVPAISLAKNIQFTLAVEGDNTTS